MVLLDWRAVRRNSLRGFARLELPSGLQIDDVAVHESHGRAWASLPARPMIGVDGRHITRDGKAVYVALLRWRSHDLADRFSAAVIELIRTAHPSTLDGATP
jgi:hypothetical protein